MRGIDSNIGQLIRVANQEYKMSYQEIADWVGVQKYMVFRWCSGKSKISAGNYEKVQDMMMRLNGYNVKYRGQAMDILRSEE